MFADPAQSLVKVEDDEQAILHNVFEQFANPRDFHLIADGHGSFPQHPPQPSYPTQPQHIGPQASPDDPGGDEPTNSKRKRPHSGKACVNCRRRKARCQGGPPTCRTCALYNDECVWDEFGDGRRPASRTYVQALKTRIRSLEEEVKVLRKPGEDAGAQGAAPAEAEARLSPGAVEVQQVANTMLHLQMNDAGEERVFCFGPTSAFAHSSPILVPSELSPSIDSLLSHPPHQPGDWRRYLPPSPYLTASQHAGVLSRFFKYFASWGLRVHPQNFFADMNDHLLQPPYSPLPRWSQYSPFLHNALLAVALIWADEPELRDPAVRVQFGRRADDFLRVELSRPLLATVQGLSVKSSYHSIDGDPTAGWAYFGMADRIARTLGLNVDCAPHLGGMMSSAEVQRRTDMFWSTFIMEQTWSIYTGRPPAMPEYSTPLPTIDTELDNMPFAFDPSPGTTFDLAPSLSASQSIGGHSVSPPSTAKVSLPKPQASLVSTTFVEHAKLAIIQQLVLTKLYGIRAPTGRVQKEGLVSGLALELDTWVEALPNSLNINGHSNRNSLPHVIMLQLARESLTIFIYRPCYRLSSTSDSEPSSTTSIEAVRRCDRSAARIITLLALYHQRFLLKYSPPPLFSIAFTAGTTFLLSAMHHPSAHVKMAALVNADKCVQYLRLSGDSWRAARRKADILQDLVNKYAMPGSGPVPTSLGALAGGSGGRQQGTADRQGSGSDDGALSRRNSGRQSSYQYPLPIPVPGTSTGYAQSPNMGAPAFNRSLSGGVKRRRDNVGDIGDFAFSGGDYQLPPMTPLLQYGNTLESDMSNLAEGYDNSQWEQLLAQVEGVFDAPEMGPPHLPAQMQIAGRVSQFEHTPFRVPSQSPNLGTPLPSNSILDAPPPLSTHVAPYSATQGHRHHASYHSSASSYSSYNDSRPSSSYTVPLPRGTSQPAQQLSSTMAVTATIPNTAPTSGAGTPSYTPASSFLPPPVPRLPPAYTGIDRQNRPTVDTTMATAIPVANATINNQLIAQTPGQAYQTSQPWISPALATSPYTLSPSAMMQNTTSAWQSTPTTTNPAGLHSSDSQHGHSVSPTLPQVEHIGTGQEIGVAASAEGGVLTMLDKGPSPERSLGSSLSSSVGGNVQMGSGDSAGLDITPIDGVKAGDISCPWLA